MKSKALLLFLVLWISSPFHFTGEAQERDLNFGLNGFVRANIDGYDRGYDVLLQNDNKIISIGTTAEHPIYADDFVAIIRYTYDGNLDTTYGDSGITKLSINNASQTFYYDAAFQSDEKLIIAGQYSTNRYLSRLTTEGIVDTSFAENGVFDFTDDDDYYRDYFKLEVIPDDKIRIFRRFQPTYQGDYAYKLQQFTSEGEVDSLYGIDGTVAFDLDTAFNYFLGNFLLLENGKMLINGKRTGQDEWGTEYSEFVLTRRNPNGSLDSTFGDNGYAYSLTEALSDMAVTSDGKIVCVGTIGLNQQGTTGSMAISRYNENGSIDSTFNFDGHASLSVDVYADYANAVCIQNDDKIVVGGSFFNFAGGSVTDCVLARYNLDGSLDMDFGDEGVFKNGLSSGTDIINEMVIQDNYKIVYVGYANFQSFDIITGRIILGDLSASPNTSICLGDSTTLYAYSDSLIIGWAIDTLPEVLLSTSDSLRVSPSVESRYLVYGINDTVSVTVSILHAPQIELTSDTTLCEGEEIVLNAFYPEASYLWQDSTTNASNTISESGIYHVEVSNQCGSFIDSTSVLFNPLASIDLGEDIVLCEGEEYELNAFFEGADYLWQDSSSSPTFLVSAEGDYWVETELNNCFYSDSISISYLTNTYSYLEITSCDSALSPSGLYTWFESGSYSDTLSNSNACDSIISIDLTISYSSINEISVSACEEYTAANGVTYIESGQYEVYLQSQSACDSLILLNLQITQLDSSVSVVDNILTSNASNVMYQWIDCATNLNIEGETSASFTPSENGSYAVVVSDSICSLSSSCISISSLDITVLDFEKDFRLYPNPSNSKVNIEHDREGEMTLILSDNQGKVLTSIPLIHPKTEIDLSHFAPGFYHIVIQQDKSIWRKVIIKM